MKTIYKICFALLASLILFSCNKDKASDIMELDGIYAITVQGGADDSKIDNLLRLVGFESEQITIFYELSHNLKNPGNDGKLDSDLSVNDGVADRIDNVSYFISVDESDTNLQFVFNDKKVSTDLFAGRGNLETLRVEKSSVDKIVLLGGNNTIIYTLTKVNNVKRVASLKNGEHADLDEIRQYAETQN